MQNNDNLVERLKAKDILAFEEFVNDYSKRIYTYAYGFTTNVHDSNDITQEVFLKVYNNIDKFKENSSLSTWIYRIVSNVCLDFVRKGKNSKVISITQENEEFIHQIEDNSTNVEKTILNNELGDELLLALDKLDEESKQVLILREVSGLSYSEISEALKLPEGTIKSRISRSRKKMRDIILELRNKNQIHTSK